MTDFSKGVCHTALNPAQTVAFCTTQGDREYQQDAYAIHERLPSVFLQLSESDRTEVLCETVRALNQHIIENYNGYAGGTTLCASFFWEDEAGTGYCCTLNIGDSATYAINLQGNHRIERINALHSTDPDKNRAEYDRVKTTVPWLLRQVHEWPLEWRLFNDSLRGSINMTRTIGDAAFASYDFFHTPEVRTISYTSKDDNDLYFVIASDGMEALPIQQIAHSFLKAQQLPLKDRVEHLVSSAYERSGGYSDNITAIAFNAKNLQSPLLVMVADGHGDKGNEIAQYVTQNFYKTLLNKMNLHAFISFLICHGEAHTLQYWETRFNLLSMSTFWREPGWDKELIAFSVSETAVNTLKNLNDCFNLFKINRKNFVDGLINILNSIIMQNFLPNVFRETYQRFSAVAKQLAEFQDYLSVMLKISYKRSDQAQFFFNLPQKLLTLLQDLGGDMDEFSQGLEWGLEEQAPRKLSAEVDLFFQLKNGRNSSPVEITKNPS